MPTDTAAAAPSTVKSIVNPKYRNKYKQAEAKDWLSKLLDAEAVKTRDVKVTKPNPDNTDEKITVTEQRPDGIDVDALFAIASNNGIDTKSLQAQRDNHGFAGRARMTIANGLRRVIKQRFGLFNKGNTFLTAPPEMLAKVGVVDGDKPTHNQDGTKIVVAKPDAPAAEAAPKQTAAEKKAAKAAAKTGTEEA